MSCAVQGTGSNRLESTYTKLFPLFGSISVEFRYAESRTEYASLATAAWFAVTLSAVSRTLNCLLVALWVLLFLGTNFFYAWATMMTC